jgi:putative membrane protein
MSDLNDPRVFFAAERTLLAWNRTSLTLMAFGFVIERFGLFVEMLGTATLSRRELVASFWIGVAFVLLGALSSAAAVMQYRKVLRTLKPAEIPEGYRVNLGVFVNLAVALLGLCLSVYLFLGFFRY